MDGQIISMNGKMYNRSIEMLGDVQKVTWFECYGTLIEQEIYDQEEMDRLEEQYENVLLSIITPPLPII